MSREARRSSDIQDEIRSLMGLRGFFTVAVVSVHLLPTLTLLHEPADGLYFELNSLMICVESFYVMSGFLLTRNYLTMLARPTRAGVRHFMVLRIARVWPLHVAMLAAILLYDVLARWILGYGVEGDLGLPNILANVFLVHEIGSATVINLPSWSLSPEAGAYVAFPLLAIGLARLRGLAWRLTLLLAILAAGSTTLWIRYQAMEITTEWSHTQAWLRMATTFTAGCLLALIWRDLPEHARAWRHWGTVATVSGIATIAGCVAMNLGDTFHPPVFLYPLLVLVILATACATGRFERVVGGTVLHWFGRISYGIYLSHFLVLISTFAVLHRLDAGSWNAPARMCALLGVVALVVVTGWIAHVLIEEPARRYIRRFARPRTATPVAGDPAGTLAR